MRISILIPTLNEAQELPGALDSVAAQDARLIADILVCDGGSGDGTQAAAKAPARLVSAPCGRARQLNAGVAEARGEVLLFLHADSRLPGGALESILEALLDPAIVGGGFHKRFRSEHALLRSVRARTWLWHRFGAILGDQAPFVRRELFVSLGGFRERARAEDLDLSWRLARRGRLVLLPSDVSTSARRLHERGILATWGRWWTVTLLQALDTAWARDRGRRAEQLSSERGGARDSSES